MSTPTAPTQWYEGSITLPGLGLAIPAASGFSGGTDENFIDAQMAGNFWQYNYAAGYQMPRVQCQLIVRNSATEAFASAFLAYFFSRTSDTAHNTSSISGGVLFNDGMDSWLLGGTYSNDSVKADSFSIAGSKGEMVNFSCTFCGTSWIYQGASPTPPTWGAIETADPRTGAITLGTPPLTFANTDFGGMLQGQVWRYGLTYSNNHRPNNAINMTNTPAAWNAGMMTGALNLEVQARTSVPTSGQQIKILYAGANISRFFSMPNVRLNNPRMRSVNPPEVMRNYQYTLLGGSSQADPILSILHDYGAS